MNRFKKYLKIAAFALLLVLAAFGAAFGALANFQRRREDPVREKIELVEQKRTEKQAEIKP